MAETALHDDDWEYPHHHKYQQYISEMMSFLHGRTDDPYPRNKTFEREELLQIRPSDVKKYICLKAYHDPSPGPNVRPLYARAESLRKVKQGVSYFMPNKGSPWIEGHGGNPTKHSSVTAAINAVEAKETKGLGVDPNDKRRYNEAEFLELLRLFRQETDFNCKFKYPMMSLWAGHLIHRLDDTAHFSVDDPHGNVEYPFTLLTRTKWSKNVKKLRQCPDQIILASDDWRTCIEPFPRRLHRGAIVIPVETLALVLAQVPIHRSVP